MSTSPAPASEAKPRLLGGAAVLFVLLVLVAFADPLATGRNFVGRDLVVYNLPLESAVHDAYARGRLPVWDVAASGGRPLLSNPNAGAFYPVRPLLSRLRFPAAMRLYPVFHWALAGLGMILFVAALGASPSAAFVGASTYVFSGVMMSEVSFTNFQPGVALLPWTLWAWVRRTRAPGSRMFLTGAFLGLLFLNGDVFTSATALGAVALWIFVETPPPRRRSVAELAGAVLLGALLAAPQILATGLLVPETHRAVGGMRLAEVFGFSLSPWRLLELVVPYPFGDTWSIEVSRIWGKPVQRFFFATLYCGALAPAGVLAILRRPDRRGERFARALAPAALALAVLPSLAPAALLSWRSPIPLRYPEKFSVAATFALATAAGLALDRFRSARPPRWLLPAAASLAAVAALAAARPGAAGDAAGARAPRASEVGRQIAGAAAEGGVYCVSTLVALELRRRGTAGRAIALALLATIPVLANRRIARVESEAAVFAPPPFARAIARKDPAGSYRALDESVFLPRSRVTLEEPLADPGATDLSRRAWYLQTPGLWRRGTVFTTDLDVGDLSRTDSLKRYSIAALAPGGSPDPAGWLGGFALRFGIRWSDLPPVPGFVPFGRDGRQIWDENPFALEDVRLLTRWRERPGAVEALAALGDLARGEAVIESGRRGDGRARGGTVRFLERSPERLRLELAALDPTWLFVLRGFWGWRRVAVDGKQVAPAPAQLAFTAVPVPAGLHRVEWTERVPGGGYSWAGPLLFGLAWGWRATRKRAVLP